MKVIVACIWGILFNAAAGIVRIRLFPDPPGDVPLRNRGCGNAARGLHGHGSSPTRPVTYRSETVGVAERVLCPVRCVANAFSCVLSGWWQTTIIAVQTASAVLAAGCFVMLLVSKTKKKEN